MGTRSSSWRFTPQAPTSPSSSTSSTGVSRGRTGSSRGRGRGCRPSTGRTRTCAPGAERRHRQTWFISPPSPALPEGVTSGTGRPSATAHQPRRRGCGRGRPTVRKPHADSCPGRCVPATANESSRHCQPWRAHRRPAGNRTFRGLAALAPRPSIPRRPARTVSGLLAHASGSGCSAPYRLRKRRYRRSSVSIAPGSGATVPTTRTVAAHASSTEPQTPGPTPASSAAP